MKKLSHHVVVEVLEASGGLRKVKPVDGDEWSWYWVEASELKDIPKPKKHVDAVHAAVV